MYYIYITNNLKLLAMKKILSTIILLASVSLCQGQTIETEVIKQINKIRLENGGPDKGLSSFVRNARLDSAARYHAKWIVASGTGGHTETKSAGGIKPLPEFWDRAAKYGAVAYAENLIQYCFYVKSGNSIDATKTATAAVIAWKKSPGHLANMLYTMPRQVEPRIGVAVVPYPNSDEFCIVMVVGANVDANGQIIKAF